MDQTRSDDARALEVFDRWFTAHESGDRVALAAVLAADATVHSLFKPAPVRGRDAAIAHFIGMNSTFSGMTMALAAPPATAGGRVLVEVEFSGAFTGELTWNGATTHGAGQHFLVPGVAVVRVDDDRVRSVRTWFDRDAWFQQIGFAVRPADPEAVR